MSVNADEKQVLYELADKIGYITLNRPEKLNAMSNEMLDQLEEVLDAFEADESRVGILRGSGRGFCSGFDLGRRTGTIKGAERTPWSDRQRLRGYATKFLRLWDSPKPIIAQVHGYCFAGGIQLPMCCDIVVVGEECRIGWPKLPTGGGWIGPMFSWFVGPQRAKQMSFRAGSEITGREAAEWGFASFSVPEAELDEAVLTLAQEIAKMPATMLQLKKAAVNRVFDNAGFRETVLAGVEWDVLAHKDPGATTLRGWLAELGMKDTIARYQEEGL